MDNPFPELAIKGFFILNLSLLQRIQKALSFGIAAYFFLQVAMNGDPTA